MIMVPKNLLLALSCPLVLNRFVARPGGAGGTAITGRRRRVFAIGGCHAPLPLKQ